MTASTYLSELFSLAGRVALVTGGSSGIGRAIASALSEAGARVIIAARTTAAIDTAVDDIRRRGGSCHGITADLSDRAGAHALADAAGEIDILVNSAGINLRPPMHDLDESTTSAPSRRTGPSPPAARMGSPKQHSKRWPGPNRKHGRLTELPRMCWFRDLSGHP